MSNLTSLRPLSDQGGKKKKECYTGGIFVNGLTTPLKRILQKHSVILSPKSTGYTLKTQLGSAEDRLEDHKKSGIYAALCAGCDLVYIGQSSVPCETSYSQHV